MTEKSMTIFRQQTASMRVCSDDRPTAHSNPEYWQEAGKSTTKISVPLSRNQAEAQSLD